MKPTVLIFLKAPRSGEVKTRLAADVGNAEALRIYHWLAERQLAAIPAGWPVEVHFAPAEAGAEIERWLGAAAGRTYWPQPETGLGERLARATQGAFARGAAAVFLIGGDCVELDEAVFEQAADALASHDAVLGPARDGGYYLLGLKRPEQHVFHDIEWSSSTVAETTRQRLRELGWRGAELVELTDVDTAADWSPYAARLGPKEA